MSQSAVKGTQHRPLLAAGTPALAPLPAQPWPGGVQRAPEPLQERDRGAAGPKREAKALSGGGGYLTVLICSAGGLELPPDSP